MYDRYNDVYRFVPLNGDIAGLAARTDTVADPFFSPAGLDEVLLEAQLSWRLTYAKALKRYTMF